jgi:hypothetical protein
MLLAAVNRSLYLLLRALSCHDPNSPPETLHRLIRPYFRRLATFGLAVNGDFAVGDHQLALPAAVGDAGEFEQVAEGDVFAAQFEFNGVHSS